MQPPRHQGRMAELASISPPSPPSHFRTDPSSFTLAFAHLSKDHCSIYIVGGTVEEKLNLVFIQFSRRKTEQCLVRSGSVELLARKSVVNL